MAFRRGFKTEANTTSREIRAELGLAADAPLCPFLTAKHLEVLVMKLSAFEAQHPNAVQYLTSAAGQNEFSAITVCIGTRRVIVYNDGHSAARCAANIMHELSHLLLMHPPHPLWRGERQAALRCHPRRRSQLVRTGIAGFRRGSSGGREAGAGIA